MSKSSAVGEDFLSHYGVKGMKWGQRKDRKKKDRPDISELSDAELKAVVERLALEKRYNDVAGGSTAQSGAQFLANAGNRAFNAALSTIVGAAVGLAIKRYIK